MKRILTGLKPSGELTLGSYIGGIKGTIKRQEEYESFLFVPDMHAITVRQEHDLLKERIRKNNKLTYKYYDIKTNEEVFTSVLGGSNE